MINFESANQLTKKSQNKANAELKEFQWILCSTHHDRFKVERKNNQINYCKINVNEELKKLLNSKGINYEKSNDLKSEILNIDESKFLKNWGIY